MSFFDRYTLLQQVRELSKWRSIQARRTGQATDRSRELAVGTQEDAWALALVLLALVDDLVDKGIVRKAQLIERIKRLDAEDGASDGQMDPDKLRQTLELSRPAKSPGLKSFPSAAAAAKLGRSGRRKA